MFIVYTKIMNGTPNPDCYYYGTYQTRFEANEVALDLGGAYPTYHCICKAEDAKTIGIQNLPR